MPEQRLWFRSGFAPVALLLAAVLPLVDCAKGPEPAPVVQTVPSATPSATVAARPTASPVLRPTPPALGTIELRVTSPEGLPVPGCPVVVLPAPVGFPERTSPQSALPPPSATSDADGIARLQREPGAYCALAHGEGFALVSSDPILLGPGFPRRNAELVLWPAGRLAGRVVAPDGSSPVAGATVTCTLVEAGLANVADPYGLVRTITVPTGPDGRFVVERRLWGFAYRIDAETDEGSVRADCVPALPDTDVTLCLAPVPARDRTAVSAAASEEVIPGVRLAGVVTGPDGAPLPSAWIEVLADAPDGSAWARATLTDLEGRFHLEHLPPGAVQTRVTARDFLPGDWERLETGRDDHRLVLRPGTTVQGLVVLEDGGPAPGAWVWAGPYRPGGARAISRADGGFVLAGVAENAVLSAAKPAADRMLRGAAELLPGQPADGIVLVLRDAYRVSGRVYDERSAAPVAGVRLRIDALGTVAESDAAGGYILAGVPSGAWEIAFDRVPAGLAPRQGSVAAVVEATHVSGIDVRLARVAILEGVVLDPALQPLDGAVICGLAPERPPLPPVVSDSRGRFAIDNPPAGAALTLLAGKPGFAPGTSTPVRVRDDGTSDATPELVLRLPGAVSGRVRYEDGPPATDVIVKLRAAGFDALETVYGSSWTGEPDEDGQFTLVDAPPGAVEVDVHPLAAPESVVAATTLSLATGEARIGVDLVLPRVDLSAFLAGVVRYEDGKPLAAASVTAEAVSLRPDGAAPGSRGAAQTDPEGRFRIAGLAPGAFRVYAALPESTGPAATVTVTAPAEGVELVVRLVGSVSGRVVDAGSGQPVKTFEVALVRTPLLPPERPAESFADAPDGRFVLEDVPMGSWQVRVVAPGYPPAHSPVFSVGPGAAVEDLEVALARFSGVEGTVADEQGEPVAGALVSHETVTGARGEVEATSDAEGRFALEDVPPGPCALRAVHPDYAEAVARDLDVPAGQVLRGVRIVLERGGRIEGHVRRGDGTPVVGRQIAIAAKQSETRIYEQPATDEEGFYFAERLPSGEYVVRLSGVGVDEIAQSARRATVRSGETTVVDFTLGGVRLYGTVTRGGEALTHAQVAFTRLASSLHYSGTTDDAGDYEITGVASGEFQVLVFGQAMEAIHHSESMEIPADVAEWRHDIALPAGTIEGMVVAQGAERVVAGAQVQARPAEAGADPWESLHRQAVTDRAGSFVLTGLPPGVYTLTAAQQGYGPATVTVSLGENEHKTGVLIEMSERALLRVRVTDAESGQPILATIAAQSETGGLSVSGTDVRQSPDGEGTYELDLQPGRYRVSVVSYRGYRGVLHTVEVAAGDATELDAALEPGTLLHVNCTNVDGAPVNVGQVAVVDAAGALDAAFIQLWMNMAMCVVAPGPGRVTVTAEGYAPGEAVFNAPVVDRRSALAQPHRVEVRLAPAP